MVNECFTCSLLSRFSLCYSNPGIAFAFLRHLKSQLVPLKNYSKLKKRTEESKEVVVTLKNDKIPLISFKKSGKFGLICKPYLFKTSRQNTMLATFVLQFIN